MVRLPAVFDTAIPFIDLQEVVDVTGSIFGLLLHLSLLMYIFPASSDFAVLHALHLEGGSKAVALVENECHCHSRQSRMEDAAGQPSHLHLAY